MSATSVTLTFGVVINDPEKWTPEHLAAAEADREDCDDWAMNGVSNVMRVAGDEFMRLNPDLFKVGMVI